MSADLVLVARTCFFPLIGGKFNLLKTLCDRWQSVHALCPNRTCIREYNVEDMKNAGIQNVEGVMLVLGHRPSHLRNGERA